MRMLLRCFLGWAVLAAGIARGEDAPRYPRELAPYRFFARAPWRSIVPLVTTLADVRRVLGDPADAQENYGTPYPGDAVAKRPLFIYRPDKHWQVLVYFVGTYLEDGKYPPALRDRVLSVDFIPEEPLPFRPALPAAFKKSNVLAADAAWDEFTDGSGLKYEVYTTGTPFGRTKPGDLNRISYGASAAELARASIVIGR